MAGRGADEGRRKLPGSGRAHPSRPRPEVTAPRTEIAAMERREAPALPTMERGKTEDWCADWRSIPSAFCRGSTPPGPLVLLSQKVARDARPDSGKGRDSDISRWGLIWISER